MKTITFEIAGMHCASCAVRNEKSLRNIGGVREAAVNFATHSATVHYEEEKINEQALYDAVIKNGYKIMAGEQSHVEHQHEAQKDLAKTKNKAVAAIVLSLPVLFLATSGYQWLYGTWIQAILGTMVILGLGAGFHLGMLRQARHGAANMDTLISLGTLAAFGLLSPMIAAGAMALSSVSVIGNSLRIRRQNML